MNQKLRSVTLLILGVSAAGCSSLKREPDVDSSIVETTEVQGVKTNEAAQASQEYEYAQKTRYVEDMKRELADMKRELDRLSATVNETGDAVKSEAKTQLNALQGKWRDAKVQLDLAERATENTWSDVKSGFKQSHEDLKGSVVKTRQWLSDKIEP